MSMTNPYKSHFDGAEWPWTLVGNGGWYSLHDASGRYVSDACVEGTPGEFADIARALRDRSDKRFKRCCVVLIDDHFDLYSPRNSLGGYARLPVERANDLAAIIEEAIASELATP